LSWIATLRGHPEVALLATLAPGHALARVRSARASRPKSCSRCSSFFCGLSLASALILARPFDLGVGTAAGAYSGGLTQSAAIGSSIDAIGRPPLDAALRQQLS